MKHFFLILFLGLSLFSYEIKSEVAKNVVLDIETEYKQCLKNKIIGHMECVKIKEEQMADLFVLDQKELRYQKSQQYKKEISGFKKNKKQNNEAEQCLNNAKDKEESKKCLEIIIEQKKKEIKH